MTRCAMPISTTVGLLSLFHSLPRSTQESFPSQTILNHKQANTDFSLLCCGSRSTLGCYYSFSFTSTPFAVPDTLPTVANGDSILGRWRKTHGYYFRQVGRVSFSISRSYELGNSGLRAKPNNAIREYSVLFPPAIAE